MAGGELPRGCLLFKVGEISLRARKHVCCWSCSTTINIYDTRECWLYKCFSHTLPIYRQHSIVFSGTVYLSGSVESPMSCQHIRNLLWGIPYLTYPGHSQLLGVVISNIPYPMSTQLSKAIEKTGQHLNHHRVRSSIRLYSHR